MLLVVHVWIIQRRLQVALTLATACAQEIVQKHQRGRVCYVRAARTQLMVFVIRVQTIRILQWVVQQLQRVCAT